MIVVNAAIARLRRLTARPAVVATGPCPSTAFAKFAAACEHDRQRVAAAFRDCLHQFDTDGAAFS